MVRADLPMWRRWWLFVVTAAVILFLIVPIFIVIPVSFSDSKYLRFPPEAYSLRWFENYWNSPEWLAATRASLTAAITLPIAMLATGMSVRDPIFGIAVLIAIFVFYTHRANIGRLRRGEEHQFKRSKNTRGEA